MTPTSRTRPAVLAQFARGAAVRLRALESRIDPEAHLERGLILATLDAIGDELAEMAAAPDPADADGELQLDVAETCALIADGVAAEYPGEMVAAALCGSSAGAGEALGGRAVAQRIARAIRALTGAADG